MLEIPDTPAELRNKTESAVKAFNKLRIELTATKLVPKPIKKKEIWKCPYVNDDYNSNSDESYDNTEEDEEEFRKPTNKDPLELIRPLNLKFVERFLVALPHCLPLNIGFRPNNKSSYTFFSVTILSPWLA